MTEKDWTKRLFEIAEELDASGALMFDDILAMAQFQGGYVPQPPGNGDPPPPPPPPPIEPEIYIYGVHDAPPGTTYVQMGIENMTVGMVGNYNASGVPVYAKYQSKFNTGKIFWKGNRWKLVEADARGNPIYYKPTSKPQTNACS
jgi:hypothetical protein